MKSPVPNNLPNQLIEIFGRDKDVATLSELLESNCLVTLVGAGGIGKTRLALEVACKCLPSFPDGVWFAGLDSINEEGDPTPLVLQACGADASYALTDPKRALQSFFESRTSLLILDNCEHVLTAAATLVNDLLNSSANLRIVATSRSAIEVRGPGFVEQLFAVSPLAVPDLSAPKFIEQWTRSPSVMLFARQAKYACEDFDVTDGSTLHMVGRICSRLDGIPLAIELAAARLRKSSLPEIVDDIEKHVHLAAFTGSRTAHQRHQTLQECIDWSFKSLPPGAQSIFRRLAVFSDSWSKASAIEVVDIDSTLKDRNIAALLDEIIGASLAVDARLNSSQLSRFRLLKPIKDFAAEQLRSTDERSAVSKKFAEWLVRLGSQRFRANRDRLFEGARHDQDFKSALAAALHGDNERLAAELAIELLRFRGIGLRHSSGYKPAFDFLVDCRQRTTPLLTGILEIDANLLTCPVDSPGALPRLESLAQKYRDASDADGVAISLSHIAMSMKRNKYQPQSNEIESLLARVECAVAMGAAPRWIAWCLDECARLFASVKNQTRADGLYRRGLELYPPGGTDDVGDAAKIAANYIVSIPSERETEGAPARLQFIIERLEEAENWGNAARTCGFLASFAREKNNLPACRSHLWRGIEFAQKGNDDDFAVECLRMLELVTDEDSQAAGILFRAMQLATRQQLDSKSAKILDAIRRRARNSRTDECLEIRAYIIAQELRKEPIDLIATFPHVDRMLRNVVSDSVLPPWPDRAVELVDEYARRFGIDGSVPTQPKRQIDQTTEKDSVLDLGPKAPREEPVEESAGGVHLEPAQASPVLSEAPAAKKDGRQAQGSQVRALESESKDRAWPRGEIKSELEKLCRRDPSILNLSLKDLQFILAARKDLKLPSKGTLNETVRDLRATYPAPREPAGPKNSSVRAHRFAPGAEQEAPATSEESVSDEPADGSPPERGINNPINSHTAGEDPEIRKSIVERILSILKRNRHFDGYRYKEACKSIPKCEMKALIKVLDSLERRDDEA